MYILEHQFNFEAAHYLHVPPGHPCRHMHGHNWVVTLALEAHTLDAHDFVVDFHTLKEFDASVRAQFDHRVVNDSIDCSPTCENLARIIFNSLEVFIEARVNTADSKRVRVWFVRVQETDGNTVSFFSDIQSQNRG